MDEIPIEQALYGSQAGGGYRFLGRSQGFLEDWLPEAERLCMGFGERPAGVACPEGLFVQPFGKKQVAIVRAMDRGLDDAGRPGVLAFHLLVMPVSAYRGWDGDPFTLADRLSPPWEKRGDLPSHSFPAEPLPSRTVQQVQAVLQRADGPNLLGGAQALVDGGRLVFHRSQPDPDLLRALWMLLPTSTRVQLWPASFAFGNSLRFHAVATPRVNEEFAGYHEESQMGDYPEGRYELAVQLAAESGNQAELTALFARPGRDHVLKMALCLMGFMLLITLVMHWVPQQVNPNQDKTPSRHTIEIPNLPAVADCRTLTEQERQETTERLRQLAANVKAAGADNAETLVENLDQALGTPDPERDAAPLKEFGPLERQLRVLLWKNGVPAYDDRRLNLNELIERLEQKVGPNAREGGNPR